MFTPETIKEHWITLKPKVRELWPNLTELDVQAINGDRELLVTKVREPTLEEDALQPHAGAPPLRQWESNR